MGLVTQLQGQVAQLTAAKEELHKQVAETQASRKAPGGSFSTGSGDSSDDPLSDPACTPGMGSFSYREVAVSR